LPAEDAPRLDLQRCPETGVCIAVPRLNNSLSSASRTGIQQILLKNLVTDHAVSDYILWYYTPMALSFSAHLQPKLTVFDCMDELSAFKGAPQEMADQEAELMRRADIVFTGGQSLYEAKLGRHAHLHLFPSSIDVPHFSAARTPQPDPEDQAPIPHPRVGYCGVIDERMDLQLLDTVACMRPNLHLILLGPVVKIDPATLPRRDNIHYLGGKSYKDLPRYLSGWDAAMLPFAHNESTRFISPTKTPEYLAAGKPAVSTSITDVVRPYGAQKLVRIADSAAEFVAAIDGLMAVEARDPGWLSRVDAFLATGSWDLTWSRMLRLMEERLADKQLEPFRAQTVAGNYSAILGD
jgi:UDP-galactopyranose mutase